MADGVEDCIQYYQQNWSTEDLFQGSVSTRQLLDLRTEGSACGVYCCNLVKFSELGGSGGSLLSMADGVKVL